MSDSVETLIVGAGPVGLFLAAELLRRGRECIVIDRLAAPLSHSKALAIMPGTMEVFSQAGIVDRFTAAVNRVDGVRFVTPRRAAYVPFCKIRSSYNYISILPQWKTQHILEERVRELGGNVRYGCTLTSLQEDAAGVDATVSSASGTRTIRARYVVGCDGVRSTVRALARVEFRGRSYPGSALLADTLVNTSVPLNEARVHMNASGVVTMFPMSESLRRIVVIAPHETLPEDADVGWLQQRLHAAGYNDVEIDACVWSNTFRVHRRVARAMRRGRIFLAGDSAHTHSPVGGQGMNVGLHDAWNLAHKLSCVLSGEAHASLLDEYERERLPVARSVVRRTHVLTRALAHPNVLVRMARERIAPAIAGTPLVYRPVLKRLSLTA